MGAWGITECQSDHGLDLLEIIIFQQLRKVDFATFNISEASDLLRQDILDDIEQYKQHKRPTELSKFYLETLTQNYTHAAVLLAECLADYYLTGELIVYDYIGEDCELVEHRIKNFIVTSSDLKPLLKVLQKVQAPEHWLYQSWAGENIRQQWLTHIRSVYQTLSKHLF